MINGLMMLFINSIQSFIVIAFLLSSIRDCLVTSSLNFIDPIPFIPFPIN